MEKLYRKDFLKKTGVMIGVGAMSYSLGCKSAILRRLFSSNFKKIDSEKQLEKIISENDKVVIDIGATWCWACDKYDPVFKEVSKEYPDMIFGKIMADKIPSEDDTKISKKYNIEYLPITLLFKGGKLISQETGFMDNKKLIEYINSNFAPKDKIKAL